MRQRARAQLAAFIVRTDHGHRGQRSSQELAASRIVGLVFSPERHGLSWAQCQLATQLLHRADQQRPLTGTPEQIRFRRALRIAGIVSSVKGGRVGNSGWGRRMLATRGGNVMKAHGRHILREIAPLGHLASVLAQERQRAQQYYERTGDVLAPGQAPPTTPEEAHIRHLTDLWEAQQWQTQRDFLSW